ncbi:MAG TPA: EI24 domain-containing protein [Sediminibacterium sp.]|nr:EI24 domain-containing protein [Sediminibacterium sp.]
MLKEIIIAIQAYYQAHQFIKANKLWKWIIIPGIIYCLLFWGGMYYFSNTSSEFIEWIALKTGLKSWLDKEDSGLLGFLFTMGGLIVWLVLMLFYFSLFKYLFLIIGSPLFSYLSEKTESIIEGKDYPFSFSQLGKDMVRGIRLAGRNGLWQTVYTISIVILSLIPVVGWLTPVMAIIIECYYYGFSMLDYSMERHKKSPSESIFFISGHKGLAIGNGLVFYIMHLIPVLGWILAPTYAVVAATLSIYPLKQQQQQPEAKAEPVI